MTEKVRYPKGTTRTLIDFQAVLDRMEQGDTIICLPVVLVDIIRKLLRDRGLWRTTYATNNDDLGYEKPTPEEFQPVKQIILSFLEDTNKMNCSDLLNELKAISSSIRAASCCAPGNGTSYVDDGEGGVFYGTEQPVDYPTVFGEGEEFETEAAFLEHLCAAANAVVNGIIVSLRAWSVLTLIQLTAGALVVAFFVATPPLAIFIALGVAAFGFGALTSIAEYIEDNRADWVCAIYGASSYTSVLARIDEQLDAAITSLGLGAFSSLLHDLFHAMASTDTINKLYTSVGLPELGNEIDCATCGPAVSCTDDLGSMLELTATIGTITNISVISADELNVTIESEYLAGEDHERTGIKLKDEYIALECGVYSNGITYDSGPGSEANLDMQWSPPANPGLITDTNPDGIHLGDGFQWIQAASISPGQFTMTVNLVRNDPS